MFPPEEFVNLALELGAASPPEESKLRTAVSRAYYGACLTAYQRIGKTFAKNWHKELIQAVRQRRRATGDKLDRLRMHRVKADYDLEAKNWDSIWREVEHLARDVLPRLKLL